MSRSKATGSKVKKVHWGECNVCGGKGQLWPSKPRVFCCGRNKCRAILFWDHERWAGAWAIAQSRLKLGVDLNDMDLYARRVVRGRIDAPRAVLPKAKKAKPKSRKAKSAKAQAKAREPKML